jgi:hypothetical protein
MNYRSIGLLAAASWLLMVPPPKFSHGVTLTDFNAPLSQWVQFREFMQRSDCERTLAGYRASPPGNFEDMLGTELAAKTMRAAQCLSTADPRLGLHPSEP